MRKNWFIKAAWCGVAVALLGACGDSSSTPEEQQGPEPTPNCTEGAPCTCESGSEGTVLCGENGAWSCDCPECPALELPQATAGDDCGGEPFGLWRLVKLEFGAQPLELSVNNAPVGTCQAAFSEIEEVPRMLISLEDGGTAQYFTEELPLQQSWSNGCVTSKVWQFSCGSSAWTNVSECKLDCDICTCDTSLFAHVEDEGTWERTESTLTVAPWGNPAAFDYCVEGRRMTLSAEGAYFEFERVYVTSAPTPCAERAPEECVAGGSCQRGACVGDGACPDAATEGECLTQEGCSWDAAACHGFEGEQCGIGDFDVVPGCELTDEAPTCTGEPVACETREAAACAQVQGCSLNAQGRCTGFALACSLFDECPEDEYGCSYDEQSGACSGETSCSAFSESESACDEANAYYSGTPCIWEESFCEGTATPCADVPIEACASQPGCQLEAP